MPVDDTPCLQIVHPYAIPSEGEVPCLVYVRTVHATVLVGRLQATRGHWEVFKHTLHGLGVTFSPGFS